MGEASVNLFNLGTEGWWLVSRHLCWQESDHCRIYLVVQEIQGLCFSSQGRPRMMGFWGDSKANRQIVSLCRAPVLRSRSSVVNLKCPVPKGRCLMLPPHPGNTWNERNVMRFGEFDINKITCSPRIYQCHSVYGPSIKYHLQLY